MGLLVRRTSTMRQDGLCMERMANRIARALLYTETSGILTDEHRVQTIHVSRIPGFLRTEPERSLLMVRLIDAVATKPSRIFGNTFT